MTESYDVAFSEYVDVCVDADSEAMALRFDDGRVYAMTPSLAGELARALSDCLHEMRKPRAVTPAKWRSTA